MKMPLYTNIRQMINKNSIQREKFETEFSLTKNYHYSQIYNNSEKIAIDEFWCIDASNNMGYQ